MLHSEGTEETGDYKISGTNSHHALVSVLAPFQLHDVYDTRAYVSCLFVSVWAHSVLPVLTIADMFLPHDTHLNSRVLADIESTLCVGCLHSTPEIRSAELEAPLFSIINGVIFTLIRLSPLDHLSKVYPAHFPAHRGTLSTYGGARPSSDGVTMFS
jgi:hypothetical protein